jgi:hypothetical protein
MKNQTILQKITDTLEIAGIAVSGIEIWPAEEDGRISVSLAIRPRPEPTPDEKTSAIMDSINAGRGPGEAPVVRDPCGECASPDCDACHAKSDAPIKLYSPEKAVEAMLQGYVLRNGKGDKFYWRHWANGSAGFYQKDEEGSFSFAEDLSGLYEEAMYV